MNRPYYTLWCRLDNKDRFLIWYSTERQNSKDNKDSDGVVLSPGGTVPAFRDQTALESYAAANGLTLSQGELNLHNLDAVARWLRLKKRLRSHQVNCNEFLSAWNLFADVSRSISGNFDPDQARTQKIYQKLFWGNNLPALTPPGRFYLPLWSRREIEIIHEVLTQGLFMFRQSIRLVAPQKIENTSR